MVWQAELPPEYGSLLEEILEKGKPKASKVVTVKLLEAVRLPARHAKAVAVKLQGSKAAEKLWMLEMWLPSGETEDPATEEAQAIVLEPNEEGETQVWLENNQLYLVKLSKGKVLGSAEPVEVVAQEEESQGISVESSDVLSLSVGRDAKRMSKLCAALKLNEISTEFKERDEVAVLVAQFQDIFVMEDEELGATHLARYHIDTGDAEPIKQYARRIPHSLRMEVRDLVNNMLDRGIITQQAHGQAR